MGILDEMLEGKKSIVILGHVNPDGDCIGSCLGLYNYLKENYEGLEVSVYLEKMGVKFSFLSGFEDVHRMPATFHAWASSPRTGRQQKIHSALTTTSRTRECAGST